MFPTLLEKIKLLSFYPLLQFNLKEQITSYILIYLKSLSIPPLWLKKNYQSMKLLKI